MGLLPDTQNCGLRMRRECQERFPRHQLKRKLLVSDPSMHHFTCVTHVPWCMSGSLTRCGGENVPDIPSAFATCNFAYLVRGPWMFTMRAQQYGPHFADYIFKRVCFKKMWISWLKFPWYLFAMIQLRINHHWLQAMAWCRSGGKPLS